MTLRTTDDLRMYIRDALPDLVRENPEVFVDAMAANRPAMVAGLQAAGLSVVDETADVVTASAPIPIPASGSNYSYIKHFHFATAMPANLISNLRVYSDGGIWVGRDPEPDTPMEPVDRAAIAGLGAHVLGDDR